MILHFRDIVLFTVILIGLESHISGLSIFLFQPTGTTLIQKIMK